ncbi:hypothetical protein PoB_002388800 [Plakobranchus ocellatus]|uniref:Uncharacterized protein n=1 Tax=Plakobranchus ocellatus TaxID=259542 RepID=A0AAV3ZRB3_9GAST|nr:hypothetical protein PoB_002388800 [Plakobranchus ocellatus]
MTDQAQSTSALRLTTVQFLAGDDKASTGNTSAQAVLIPYLITVTDIVDRKEKEKSRPFGNSVCSVDNTISKDVSKDKKRNMVVAFHRC